MTKAEEFKEWLKNKKKKKKNNKKKKGGELPPVQIHQWQSWTLGDGKTTAKDAAAVLVQTLRRFFHDSIPDVHRIFIEWQPPNINPRTSCLSFALYAYLHALYDQRRTSIRPEIHFVPAQEKTEQTIVHCRLPLSPVSPTGASLFFLFFLLFFEMYLGGRGRGGTARSSGRLRLRLRFSCEKPHHHHSLHTGLSRVVGESRNAGRLVRFLAPRRGSCRRGAGQETIGRSSHPIHPGAEITTR